MIPVLPRQNIIKHFRHVNEKAHGEPETIEHLTTKKTLYKLFQPYSNIEEKIGTRFADVVIFNKLVIECQCSCITLNELIERTHDYCESGYNVFWVFCGYYYERAQQKTKHSRKNRTYLIQKISKVGRYLDNQRLQPLLYFDGISFYIANFKYRWGKSKTLGWYNLKKTPPKNISIFFKNMLRIQND